jgi:hypothetical protein
MSLTEPPVQDDPNDVDRPPSRRFTILFTAAMLAIAFGYMWVWQAKTSRVVAEPPPSLVLGAVTSRVPGHDRATKIALRDSLAAHLRSVPRLVLADSVDRLVLADSVDATPTAPVTRRIPRRVYTLAGELDRDEDGQYSLELQRTDARTDSVVYIYRVRGPTLPEVVHRMAVQVAMSFGLPLPTAATGPAAPAPESAGAVITPAP